MPMTPLVLHAIFREELLAADADRAAFVRFKIWHLREHAACDDRLAVDVLWHFPLVPFDVFLDGDSQRMDGMLLGRSREQDHLFFVDA